MTNENCVMHDILSDLAKVLENLDKLQGSKHFKAQEWQDFLVRSSAQAQALHRTNGLCFLESW